MKRGRERERETALYTGVYKVPSPPPWGNRIKLLGKKIKWGRRERKREEGKGRGKKEGGREFNSSPWNAIRKIH